MSLTATRLSKTSNGLCSCGRHACFRRPNGQGYARRRDHGLCPGCWRRLLDGKRAEDLRRRRPNRQRVLAGHADGIHSPSGQLHG